MNWLYKNSQEFSFTPKWYITCLKNTANLGFIIGAIKLSTVSVPLTVSILSVLSVNYFLLSIFLVCVGLGYAVEIGTGDDRNNHLNPNKYLWGAERSNAFNYNKIFWFIPGTYIDLLFLGIQKLIFKGKIQKSKTFKLEHNLGLYDLQKSLFNTSLEIKNYENLLTDCDKHIRNLQGKETLAKRLDPILKDKILPEVELRIKNLIETRIKVSETLETCKERQFNCQSSANSFKDIIDLADIVSELKMVDEFLGKTKACLDITNTLTHEIRVLTENTKKDLQTIIQN